MEKYFIRIEGHLTSSTFYNEVLSQLHKYYANKETFKIIVFDFSLVKTIDPLVIPNLLCIGYVIRETSSNIPEIFIPNDIKSIQLKRYLNEINFISLAGKYNLFSFDQSIKGGWQNQGMDKLNTTIFFDVPDGIEYKSSKEIQDKIEVDITHSFNEFFNKFLSYYYEYETQTNSLLEWSKETIENSILHGKSFSFTTIQYNYKLEKVFLSYSDCGIGFKNSFYGKLNEPETPFSPISPILENKICKLKYELDGILLGIYYRSKSNFGLYSVIIQVLTKGGIIRIHSNDVQIVLSPSNLIELTSCSNESEFYTQLTQKKNHNKVRKNLKYPGTHIEIEIPIKKKDLIK